MKNESSNDILIYIGNQYNPTIDHFLEEARNLGCSRHVYRYPKKITIGKSRAFLIHDTKKVIGCRGCGLSTSDVGLEIKICPKCGSTNIFTVMYTEPVIFAYYVIQAAEFIVDDNTKLPKDYEDKGVKPIHIDDVVKKEHLRGCGRRKVGNLYLVSYPNDPIVSLNPTVPYVGEHFRGIKYIEGEQIFNESKTLKQTEAIWK